MRSFRQYRAWFSTQSKLRRSVVKATPLFVAEALESRVLLSATLNTSVNGIGTLATLPAVWNAALAALPARDTGTLTAAGLDISVTPQANLNTPDYVLLDSQPQINSDGNLAPFSTAAPMALTTTQVRHAYGVDQVMFGSVSGDGTGQTIAIVDAYDYPTASSDLHAFDVAMGLPDPPSLTRVNETGGSSLPGTDPAGAGNDDWEIEEALDVEWAHAMAPEAGIVLVEATSATDADLIDNAVNYARSAAGVVAITMSWGESESSSETALNSYFTTPSGHAGVTFLASTGDDGAPGGYPAFSPNVVAVGGTTLNADSSGDYLSESGWSDSGGGISNDETQPSYQTGVVTQSTTMRTIPDVSFDADPNTGVSIYDSYDFGTTNPWITVGGTSLSSPSWAGLIAVVDQGRALTSLGSLDGRAQTLPGLYSLSSGDFHDITTGSNGYSAGPGYDLVTGIGTPVANLLLSALASPTHLAIGVQPPATVTAGSIISPALVVDVEDANNNIITTDNSTVTLSVSGATLYGNTTVTAVNGVATFSNLSMTVAGNYTLLAKDFNDIGTASNTFLVAAASVTKLALTSYPTSVWVGSAFAVQAAVEDPYGNVVKTNSSNVTIGLSSGPGTLSGNTTVAAVAGTVSFSGLTLSTGGVYTLQINDGNLTGAVSGNITASFPATHLVIEQQPPTTVTAASLFSPAVNVYVEDVNNRIVTTGNSTVTLSVATGPSGGTLQGFTSATAVNGIASFGYIWLSTVGNYTLIASDGNLSAATSNSIAVVIAAAATLTLVQQPTNTSVGAVIRPAVTVDVLDNFGNVETSDRSTVSLAIATGPAGAVLHGNLSTHAVNGVATFGTLSLSTAGNYTLSATDGNLTNITSASFTIIGPPAKLVFGQPPVEATPNCPINPAITVDVEDVNGVLVASDSSSVTLSEVSGPGTLSGTVTVAAVNGVATFTNVVLAQLGNYTLQAVDGSLTAATTNSFAVTPAAEMFVANSGNGTIGAYTTAGGTVNAALASGFSNSTFMAISGSDVFVASWSNGTISEYTTSGATVNANLITGLDWPEGIAVSGSDLFVANYFGDTIGEYTTAGAVVNTALIAGLNVPQGVAVSGSDLFVANSFSSEVSEYTTSGVLVNAALISGIWNPCAIAVSGSDLFVNYGGTIGEYTTAGAVVNATLVSGLNGSYGIAVSGSDLFVVNGGNGTIGRYTLSGATVNAVQVSGLSSPTGICVQPQAAGPAAQLVIGQQPTNAMAGSAFNQAIIVEVEDASGNLVTSDNSNVTLSVASGPGALSGNVTVAAVNGVATFPNLSLTQAGNYTLQASDSSLTTATTNSFNVSLAPAQLVFTSQPANAKAGASLTAVVVKIEDQHGNVETADNAMVTLSGPATLAGNGSVAAVAGVATFNWLSITAVGNYTLTAADSGDGLSSVVSGNFTISPAAAANLVFTSQPGNTTAGVALGSVAVTIEDQYGNVETTDTSAVTLNGSASPMGNTAVAAINGVATFANVIPTQAGNRTLQAADSTDSLSGFASGSFTINPAAVAKLAFTIQPSNGIAGATMTPLAVTVEDQYGNPETADVSKVTLTGPATFAGNTSVWAVAGVATFTALSITAIGNYTLTAADSSDGLSSIASGNFIINPAAAAKLVFTTQPANALAGAVLAPVVVTLEDQFGNVVVMDTSVVTLTDASLVGNTSVAAGNGAATFTNLVLTQAGNSTLSAADSTDSLSGFLSGNFTIRPAAIAKLVFTSQPANAKAGAVLPAVAVTVADQYGNRETTDSSTVTLTGPATLSGNTSVAAVAGVATFTTLSITTAGNYTLTAADSADGLSSIASGNFTISPGTANELVFTTQPISAQAGTLVPVAVTIEDQYGNVEIADASTVKLTGPATLTGNTAAAVAGVANFNALAVTAVGIYTLTAADSTDSLSGFVSGNFTISVAAAAKVAFTTQPGNGTAGAVLAAVAVTVEDQYGNRETTDTSTATLSGPASLTGNTSATAVAGVATFSNLSMTVAGCYTLSAADGSLTGATSSTFQINAAASAKLVFTSYPVSLGLGIGFAVQTVVEDQYNNVVKTDTSNVTISVNSGPGTLSGTTTVAAVAGTASFSGLKVSTAGAYVLAVSDGSLTGAVGGSLTASLVPTHLAFGQSPPVTVSPGSVLSPAITVDVEDFNNNIFTTDTSNVTIAIKSGPSGGTLGGTATVAAVNGVATFSNLSLTPAGYYTLLVTDGNLTSLTSGTVTVAGPAAKLAFAQQPDEATASYAIAPALTVNVEDASGIIVPTDSSSVNLSLASGPGLLSGNLSVAAVNGVATFTNVVLSQIGNDTLQANDGSLAATTTNRFAVTSVAEIFVVNSGNSTLGEYTTAGTTVNASLVSAPSNATFTAVSGADVFVSSWTGGTIGEYTITGATVNASLISALSWPYGLAISGSDMFVANAYNNTIGEYTTAGATVNASLASGLNNARGLAISGSNLFVVNNWGNNIGEYTTAGATVNKTLVSGLNSPSGIAISGSNLFVLNSGNGTIGEYTTAGTTVNAALVSGLNSPYAIAASGSDLYVTNGNGTIGRYTTGGATINAVLVSGLNSPTGLVVEQQTPGSTAQLLWAQQPTKTLAGNAISPAIIVDLKDANGNLVTTDNSNVTMSVASGPGVLGGHVTVAAVNGVATFANLLLTQAGNYTLVATDGSLTSANSASFTLIGAPAKLVFGQTPANAAPNSPITPGVVVDVEDSNGSVVPTDSSSVTLALASGPGVLSGNLTVAAVNGVATFGNVLLNQLGNYTLQASDGALTSATSNSFTIGVPYPIYVANNGNGTIGEYTNFGATLNGALVTGLNGPYGLALSGSDLFVVNYGNGTSGNGSIGEYTTSGAVVNAALVTGLNGPRAIAMSGSDLFVTNATTGTIGEYTTSGATVNAALVTGLSSPWGIAVSGSNLFVTNSGNSTIGEYTTAGATVNAALIGGLLGNMTGIAVSGSYVYAEGSYFGTATVGEFTTGGAVVTPFFIQFFGTMVGITVSGTNLLVTSNYGIGEYTTARAFVNSIFLTGKPEGICVGLPAAQLAFAQQPTGGTAGGSISPAITVDVQDANGNLISYDNANITLSLASGPGALSGDLTVAAVNGVATFANVVLTQAGDYTLQAADSTDGLGGFASSSFNIINPAWLSAASNAAWNANTQTLTVTGNTTITGDPNNFGASPTILDNGTAGNFTVDTLVADGGDGDAIVSITAISGNGTTTINAGNSLDVGNFSQAVLVNNGAAEIDGNGTVGNLTGSGNLTVGNGSSTNPLVLATQTTSGILSGFSGVQTALTISSGSTLDITNNVLLLDYGLGASPLAAVTNAVAWGSGYGTNTNGAIISSTVNVGPVGKYAVGYADHTEISTVPTGNVEVAYTLAGDANLDGSVDILDYQQMAPHYDEAGVYNWSQGDFNHDGHVDILDYQAMAPNYDSKLAAGTLASAGALTSQAAGIVAATVTAQAPGSAAVASAAVVQAAATPASKASTPLATATPVCKRSLMAAATTPAPAAATAVVTIADSAIVADALYLGVSYQPVFAD